MIMTEERCLSAVRLFAALSPQGRAQIEKRCKWASADTAEFLVHHGDNSSEVYFVTKGRARVSIYGGNGRAVRYREIKTGDYFGEFAAIDGQERSASVEALEPCSMARLSSADFLECLHRHPDISIALLQNAIGEIRVLTERVFELSTLTVGHRVQAEQLRLARKGTVSAGWGRIAPAPRQHDFADRIGTNREGVSREFGNLEALGVIRRDKTRSIDCDLVKLEMLVIQDGK